MGTGPAGRGGTWVQAPQGEEGQGYRPVSDPDLEKYCVAKCHFVVVVSQPMECIYGFSHWVTRGRFLG